MTNGDVLFLEPIATDDSPYPLRLEIEEYDDSSYRLTPDYKYNELTILDEIKRYIDSTYDQHYAQGKYQATETIIDDGHGIGFCLGNNTKYIKRYGKKGTPADWRIDLMKSIHYSIIALYAHDLEHNQE
jgi:hypothetical protein